MSTIRKPFDWFMERVAVKSWSELHTFFDTILKSSSTKSTTAQQLEEYRSWVHIATSAIYRRVGSVSYGLIREDTEEKLKPSSSAYKRIMGVINKPNEFHSFRFLKQYVQLQLDLTGKAFVLCVQDVFGRPIELYPLNVSQFVKLQRGKSYNQWITGFVFQIDDNYITFSPNNILYFHYPHPEDPCEGCSPIKNQSFAIDVDHYIEVYERDFFKNSARPDFLLQFPENISIETEEEAERIKAQWKKNFGGAGQFHSMGVIDRGGKILELTPKNADLDLGFLADWSADKILAAYNVPPGKVGLVKDVNRANALGIDVTFNSESIKPRLDLLDDVFSRGVTYKFDPRIRLQHANPIPRDHEAEIKEYEKKVGVPMWTINEAREKDGRPPVKGGDEIMMPLNYSPLSMASLLPLDEEEPVEEPSEEEPEKSEKGKAAVTKEYSKEWLNRRWHKFKLFTVGWERTWVVTLRNLFEAQQLEVLVKLDKYGNKAFTFLNATKKMKKAIETLWISLLSKYAGWSIEKVAQDLQKDSTTFVRLCGILCNDSSFLTLAVEGLLTAKSKQDILIAFDGLVQIKQESMIDGLLFDWKGNKQIFSEYGKKLTSQIMKEHGQEELNFLDVQMEFDLSNPYAVEFLGDKVEQFSDSVLSTKVDQLRRTLQDGFESGESIAQLSDRVKNVYTGVLTGGYEAQRIARTETISASNAGSQVAYEQSMVVADKGWLSTRDQRTRGADSADPADHLSMDGQRVPLDKPFIDRRTGASLMFPGDTSLGAGGNDIINCRCTMVPYKTKSEDGPDFNDLEELKKASNLDPVGNARLRQALEKCYA